MTPFAWANTYQTQIWGTFKQFAAGNFENTTLTSSGELEAGYPLKPWTKELQGAVTALVRWDNQVAYVATSGPGQVWQVEPSRKPKLVFELKQPLITNLFRMPNGDLAIISGPKGGITYVRPGAWKKFRSVAVPGTLFGASIEASTISLVGDSPFIFRATGLKLEKTPLLPAENQLRSIYKNYLGSANSGTVYRDQTPALKVPGEVVALTGDSSGNVFAAINTTKSSSQIWKLEEKGTSCLIWQSSSEIIYALAYYQSQLFWGSGPDGHLFAMKPKCDGNADILFSLEKQHRIMAIDPFGKELTIATAQNGAVFTLHLAEKAKSGRYLSPVVQFSKPIRIGANLGTIWLGNTPVRDPSWWNHESNKKKEGLFAQAEVQIAPGKPVDRIYFGYTQRESEPRLQTVYINQREAGIIIARAELSNSELNPTRAYQFELESLGGDRVIMQPYAKSLSVSYPSDKLPQGLYRVQVLEQKTAKTEAQSDWFEVN